MSEKNGGKMSAALRLSYSVVQAVDNFIKGSVVVCHGLFGSKQNWKSISHALANKGCGKVVAVDLRNHGSSPQSDSMNMLQMSEDILKLVDDLDLKEVTLVGHSLGGKVAMCASLMNPENFDRLIVLDISPVFTSVTQNIIPYIDLMLSTDLYQIDRESDGTISDIRRLLLNQWKEKVPDLAMREFLITNIEKTKHDIYWRVNLLSIKHCWHHLVGFPKEELKNCKFDKPTLFIRGEKSDYLKPSDLPAIRGYFPKARLVSVTNAGHWVHADNPYAVLDLFTSFIENSNELELPENVKEYF